MRRLLSNRKLVGALAVVFVVLLAGVLLAGPGGDPPVSSAQAASVGPVPSPTVTAVMVRNTSSPTPTIAGQRTVPVASGNVTPRPNATVLVVKTLDRYIQNAGGDPGSQLRTPAVPATPTPPTPVPTSASVRMGTNLSWSGEGTYVTEPFALEAGTIRVEMGARVLTMAQLRDGAGTAIGIATAGPQPATTTIRVPAAGMYRLEIWPFGSGPWTVTISYDLTPAAAPTPAPATVTMTAPTAIVTSGVPTTGAETPAPTTLQTLTAATTEVPTTEPTATPTPLSTQAPRTFTGDNGTFATPMFTLNEGLALFTYSTTATGNFSVTLVGSGETVLLPPTVGPLSGSKGVAVPATGSYLLNVAAPGPWKVSIA